MFHVKHNTWRRKLRCRQQFSQACDENSDGGEQGRATIRAGLLQHASDKYRKTL